MRSFECGRIIIYIYQCALTCVIWTEAMPMHVDEYMIHYDEAYIIHDDACMITYDIYTCI